MKITNHKTDNPEIDLIELAGELIGSGAIELQDYLYGRLDKGWRYQLMNLQSVHRVDGLGIKVICDFVKRAMAIGLFNVEADIRMMLRLSGKEGLVRLYNETDSAKVVTMFENDVIKADIKNEGPKNRLHTRITTGFQAEFKYHPCHNGVITGRTRVINLSEGGLMACDISAVHEKNGETVKNPELEGQELYGMNFRLNGDSDVIEARGECIREYRENDKLCAGIRFKDINNDHKEKIRDYVNLVGA
ncbi:MAG: PilZ domain-containing protein [Candidatus Anammoxibacter sp.]